MSSLHGNMEKFDLNATSFNFTGVHLIRVSCYFISGQYVFRCFLFPKSAQ